MRGERRETGKKRSVGLWVCDKGEENEECVTECEREKQREKEHLCSRVRVCMRVCVTVQKLNLIIFLLPEFQ